MSKTQSTKNALQRHNPDTKIQTLSTKPCDAYSTDLPDIPTDTSKSRKMLTEHDCNSRLDSLKITGRHRNVDIPTWTPINLPYPDITLWETTVNGDHYEVGIVQQQSKTQIGIRRGSDSELIVLPHTDDAAALDTISFAFVVPHIAYNRYNAAIDTQVEADIQPHKIDFHDQERTDAEEPDIGINSVDVERLICLAHAAHDDVPEWERVEDEDGDLTMNGWLHLRDDYAAVILAATDEANAAVLEAHHDAISMTGLRSTEYSSVINLLVEAVQNPEFALKNNWGDDAYDDINIPARTIIDDNPSEEGEKA